MMDQSLILDPFFDWRFIWSIAAIAALMVGFAIWQRLAGWWLRALAAIAVIAALINPVLQAEDRAPLSDIVFVISDRSDSQSLGDRPAQIDTGLAALRDRIGTLGAFELVEVTVENDPEDQDSGSMVLTALSAAASKVAVNRIAGAIVLTDGRIHDAEILNSFPAPVHVLQTGHSRDWDRRVVVKTAPAFAIVGEEVVLELRIETQGAVPREETETTKVEIAVDGGPPQEFQVRQNRDLRLPIQLDHGGVNVIQFTTPTAQGELTERNNSAVVSINGVRDRLRVLLVSGEPYAGGRTWRNLLKSDPAVDLVHFTILRSQDKMDGVPVRELSLIAFPTRELFLDKIEDFDLIIFDKYKRRGMLRPTYLDNVAQYVRNGGAVLFTTGPDFAGVNSLFRSELEQILPAVPSAQVIEEGYKPRISDIGARHPVTEGLENLVQPSEVDGEPGWGRWFRLVDAQARSGNVLMTGVDERPLLVLDRVEEGRVAVILSDHAWLWSRGFEGGGPQLELLRRLAHWMMKEPELEEEQLRAEARGNNILIERRSLTEEPRKFTITTPDGTELALDAEEVSPGRWQSVFNGSEQGLYRITDGEETAVAVLGPPAPREFEQVIADAGSFGPLMLATGGGVLALEDVPEPKIRLVREGRSASGRDWLGVTPRAAFLTQDVERNPLLPAWLWLLLAGGFIAAAWWREG